MSKKTITIGEVKFIIPTKGDDVTVQIGKTKKTVKAIDLWNVAFTLSDDVHKDMIMPVRKTEMMKFKKVFNVQLKNDMKAGEILTYTWLVDVPTLVMEGMKNLSADDAKLLTTAIADARKGV